MRFIFPVLLLTACVLFAASEACGQSLLQNGDFKDPTDPFKGWVTDYAWTQNSNYVGNKDLVTIGSDGTRKCANFGDNSFPGVKLETRPFPLEPGFKYTCSLDIKGGGYRVYFAGYQWAPGIAPHDNPELSELRMIYQSKALIGSGGWTRQKLELPGVALSDDAKAHLKKVRYLTVYIWMAKPGSVTDVTLTKTPDPSMKF